MQAHHVPLTITQQKPVSNTPVLLRGVQITDRSALHLLDMFLPSAQLSPLFPMQNLIVLLCSFQEIPVAEEIPKKGSWKRACERFWSCDPDLQIADNLFQCIRI